MNFRSGLGETRPQELRAELAYSHDRSGVFDQILERNDELARSENIVRMSGKAIRYAEELIDPKSRSRRHPREMDMQLSKSTFFHVKSDVDRLIQTEKIR